MITWHEGTAPISGHGPYVTATFRNYEPLPDGECSASEVPHEHPEPEPRQPPADPGKQAGTGPLALDREGGLRSEP